jgi:hypothetical protein
LRCPITNYVQGVLGEDWTVTTGVHYVYADHPDLSKPLEWRLPPAVFAFRWEFDSHRYPDMIEPI